jgi:hypothetical protein
MAGHKDLSLRDHKGNVIHTGFRYKHIRTAVRKALDLVMMEGKNEIGILDLSRGFLLASIYRRGRDDIRIMPHYPTTFKNLWRL